MIARPQLCEHVTRVELGEALRDHAITESSAVAAERDAQLNEARTLAVERGFDRGAQARLGTLERDDDLQVRPRRVVAGRASRQRCELLEHVWQRCSTA